MIIGLIICGSVIFLIGIILGLIYIYFRKKGNEDSRSGVIIRRSFIIFILVGLLAILAGGITNYTSSRKKHVENINKTEREKGNSLVNSKKINQEKQNANLKNYKKVLQQYPKQTKNTITQAYIDPEKGYTTLILKNDILKAKPDQQKKYVKDIYKEARKISKRFIPIRNKYQITHIVIKTKNGTQLATTSNSGNLELNIKNN